MFALNTPTQAFSNQREEELLEQSGGEKSKLKVEKEGRGGQIVCGTVVFSSVVLAFIVI